MGEEKVNLPIHPTVRAMAHEILLIESLKTFLFLSGFTTSQKEEIISSLRERVTGLAEIVARTVERDDQAHPALLELANRLGIPENAPSTLQYQEQYLSVVNGLLDLLHHSVSKQSDQT